MVCSVEILDHTKIILGGTRVKIDKIEKMIRYVFLILFVTVPIIRIYIYLSNGFPYQADSKALRRKASAKNDGLLSPLRQSKTVRDYRSHLDFFMKNFITKDNVSFWRQTSVRISGQKKMNDLQVLSMSK